MSSILIAETDPRTLDLLPRILSDQLPDVVVDVCSSVADLRRNRKLSTYETITINPVLLQDAQLPKYTLAPLLVTASLEECEPAIKFLQNKAFDVIVKPVVPQEAVQTVRVALWQNKLLRLLTSKERAHSRFQEHMKRFPHARTMEEEFASKMATYERTFQALTSSLRHLLNNEEEGCLFDMAGVVESMTRQRGLDRLHVMCENATTH